MIGNVCFFPGDFFKGNRCKATVVQRPGNLFEFGRNHHNHPAPVGGMVAAKIKSLIKQEARQDVFWPASEVVNDLLTAPASSYDHKTRRT